MPRLWTDTLEEHRREVREAVTLSAARLVRERGLLGVTMAAIAEEAGIGRATLYKYFPDVEAILHAWHEEQIERHLAHLEQIRARPGAPLEKLRAVLEAFALIAHETRRHRDNDLAAFLHHDGRVTRAESRLRDMVQELVAAATGSGRAREDVPPRELASYCLNAVGAAAELSSRAAVRRLVDVTLDGLRRGG